MPLTDADHARVDALAATVTDAEFAAFLAKPQTVVGWVLAAVAAAEWRANFAAYLAALDLHDEAAHV